MENTNQTNGNLPVCNGNCKNCTCKYKEQGEIIRYGVKNGILDASLKIAIIVIILSLILTGISIGSVFLSLKIFFNSLVDSFKDMLPFLY
ncbi:hypothetical protein [[Clostridium] colinum]|uniref:hypothetical protein n=1 Tax=[Clostridium] colinum TaxID=36835 RepID=UPI002024C9F1|nr:hypothetical protein [[Clostridium] colinum]